MQRVVIFAALTAALVSTLTSSRAAAQATATVTGRVTDAASGQPLPDAQVRVVGTAIGAPTRADGSYRLTVPAGSYDLRVTRLGYHMTSRRITAASGETVTADFALSSAPVNLDAIAVTGTRRPDRTVLEAPVPVDVLSAADIRATGLTETSQILQMLVPSINFPRPSVNDGTDHVRPVTLRGLGPDQVLVLINGKRRHTTALIHINQSVGRGSTSVDLNAIPANSIERIEVLRDGAAAQYGSDAIAGVINIVMKDNATSSLGMTVGQMTKGDGRNFQVEGNLGTAIGTNGFLHLSAEYRDRDSTNRSRLDRTPQCTGSVVDLRVSTTPRPSTTWTVPPSQCTEGPRQSWQGDPKTRDWGLFANGAIPLGASSAQLYAFGGYTRREGLAAGFFRQAFDNRTVRAVYGNGFLPLIGSNIDDKSAAAGVRGTVSGWNYDLSGVFGGNGFEFDVRNSINTSLGPSSPRTFEAGTLRFDQLTFNADVVRQIEIGLATPLNFALGAEVRRDHFKQEAGDPASYQIGTVPIQDGPNAGFQAAPFAQVFPGYRGVDEKDVRRTNLAAYVDLETNLASKLLVATAGRYERYGSISGPGANTSGAEDEKFDSFDGKLAMRWEVLPAFALRGAIQTGFRAPSLAQSYFSAVSTNFIQGIPFELSTLPVTSVGGQVLGAVPLRPEKSVNGSLGLTWRPYTNASLTVDGYEITIDDRVVFSSNFTADTVQKLLERAGYPPGTSARYFTNAIDTRTRGLDIIANVGFTLSATSLVRFTAGYNTNYTKLKRISVSDTLRRLGLELFDRVQRGTVERGQPRSSINLTGNYRLRNLDLTLHTNRFGEITRYQPVAAGDRTFRAKWITDLSVSFRLLDQLTLAAGGNNIFDVYPDTQLTRNQTRGIYLYDGYSPFGFNGAYWFGRVTYELARVPFVRGRQTPVMKARDR